MRKEKTSGSIRGIATTVRRLKAGFKILSDDGNEYGPFSYENMHEDLAEALGKTKWQSVSNVAFTINKNMDFLYDIHPTNCSAFVRFRKFNNAKDKPPMFASRTDKWNNTYLRMFAQLEVVGGKLAGTIVPKELHYLFEADPDTGLTMIRGGINADRLELFLNLAGYTDDDDFEWSVNVLPQIQAILLRYNNVFLVNISESGWGNEISRADPDTAPKAPPR